jgi:hypothetical protein
MAEALSGATGALQGTVGGMLNKGSAWLDSIFPPEKRNELIAKMSKFATEKPMLAVRRQISFLSIGVPEYMVTDNISSHSSPPK